ncbi:MAG: hypothetical protein KDD82_19355, partial [Planctomycetes bacterium]|nr:hypothetical protein [Planctomycetota bacterium]
IFQKELDSARKEIELTDRINDLSTELEVSRETTRALKEQLTTMREGGAGRAYAGADLPSRPNHGRAEASLTDPDRKAAPTLGLATPRGLSLIQEEPDREISVEIIADPYDRARVDALYRDSVASGRRLLVYTESQVGSRFDMGLFGDFAPSVIVAINRHHGASLPYRESHLREFAFSKLCHLYCTLLKSVMFRFGTPEAALSKLRGLRSVATILGRPELAFPVQEVQEGEVVSTFTRVLLAAAQLLDEVEIPDDLPFEARPAVSHGLGYVAQLQQLLGPNLRAVLLYGSSATGEGADFDNVVVVERLDAALLEALEGVRLYEGAKEVGVILVEASRVRQFLMVNVSNTLFRRHARVLYGEVDLPVEGEAYAIRKEAYHAGFGSTKLVAALNLVYHTPEVLVDKAGLFEYFMKLNRFTFHGLSQIDGYQSISKAAINHTLAERYEFELPAFRSDPDYIRECFLAANHCSALLAQRLYSPRKAKGRREVLLKLLRVRGGGELADASLDGSTVYVFRGREQLRLGQVVPVQVLEPDTPRHAARSAQLRRLVPAPSPGHSLGERV